jgi:AraC-like DNA-binding protein
MDILAEILRRVRLSGTLLYHYDLSRPWGLALPALPCGVFHYLSAGSATLQVQKEEELVMSEGDFVLVSRGDPHVLRSDRKAKPFPLLELHRPPAHLDIVRHGGGQKPLSIMICGYFSLLRPSRSSVLELLPPILLLKSDANRDWLDTILRRMVTESALALPGQQAVLSRMTEVLFVEVLRSWIESLRPGEGGWLGALRDSHVGKALQLIHEQPNQAWTLREVGRRVGLGRSAFAARFSELVGQPMNRYLIAHRMELAASLLERDDDSIAEIASRVGYETTSAFSKLFRRHHRISPGRYRAGRRAAQESTSALHSPI